MTDTAPQECPRFAYWLMERRRKIRPTALELGCSHEQLRRALLPFDDPKFLKASAKLRQKVQAYTKGAIGDVDWLPSFDDSNRLPTEAVAGVNTCGGVAA